ncbi:MAG TPA: malate synthase A [Flavitalea sp.]|nr:malate synthase A [Flavitalea sp.]
MHTVASFPRLDGLEIKAPYNSSYEQILTTDALAFVIELHRQFNDRRKQLLLDREVLQEKIDKGWTPKFPEATRFIRERDWKVAPIPYDLLDRRVEITGPVERKMMINALNSGAQVFMADLEDSNAPSWDNNIQGQVNLKDAVDGTISFSNPDNGKEYTLNAKTAILMVRPRGWHLEEKHILIDGEPASASLVDFGLYFFHNAVNLMLKKSGPYFYLPKLESYLEARLWNDVFVFAQDYLTIARKTIKATVLIETILASFQLHEILWELQDHVAGLNCGRWDYIFSYIKKFRNIPGFILPDRAQVTMTTPFMRAYTQLVVKTCHQRGAFAIGGMAAQIPVKNNPAANESAMAKVKADKFREVKDGHDGTWVAHPALVPVALEIFTENMDSCNQLSIRRDDFTTTEAELLQLPEGTITEDGIRSNINIGILYLESWLRGQGAAAIHNLMEDAATAEISRTQVWQWLHNNARLADGRIFTHELYEDMRDEEIITIRETVGNANYQKGQYIQAICLFNRLIVSPRFEEFLTLSAYNLILSNSDRQICFEHGKERSEQFVQQVLEAV